MKTLSIKKLLASTLALAALTLTACNNFGTDDEENTETGAYLKVSGSTARTIAPNYSLEDMTEFELYGYNSRDTYYLFGEFDSYAELQEAVIAIERGTYRLYLSAYDENTKTKFTAGQYNVEITDGLNKVEFNLSPYTGTTGIRVTFTIPDANAVKSVQAGLFDRSTDEESRYRIEPLPLSITDEGARAVYERVSIDPGTYRLKAWFYADEEQKALVTTYSELVKVTRSSMSSAERVLSKLNDIYTITENMEGGEYSGYRTPETVYTRYNSDIIKLPERSEMKKEGYFFDGWFTAPDGAGEQITEVDPAEGKNITVYAKWIRGCAISSPFGFTDNESYGDTYMVRLIDIWSSTNYQTELAKKLREVSGDKHITLDMTHATGIVSLGSFSDCTVLTSIEIPESVRRIGASAFKGCTALTSITIPENVESIDKSAFKGCTSLTSITIPENVTNIGASAFQGCTAITSITIPENVESIDESAFEDCTALTSITILGKVTSINKSTFAGCKSLMSITIPESVESIAESAFAGCKSLTSITIPDSVTSIQESTFEDCTSLTSITIPDSVTSIRGYAFQNCTTLDVVIPDSVTSISSNAVAGCRSAALGKNLVSERSSSLSSILGDCKSVIIKDDVTDIGDRVFQDCTALENVTIPDSVKEIGDAAFQGCAALKSVVIPDSVTVQSLGVSAFKDCTNCTVTLGFNLVFYTSIQNGVLQQYFNNCKAVIIKDNVNTIGDFAFFGFNCQSLTIPSSVTTISDAAFQGTQIKEVHAESLKAWLGINFYNERSNPCNNGADLYIGDEIVSDIEIPDIYEIKKYAFYGCKTLKSVRMHNKVKEICNNAFAKCTALESVEIGDGVTTIGSSAFYDCTSLSTITFTGTAEQWITIKKGGVWHNSVPATKVTCTGGGKTEIVDLD